MPSTVPDGGAPLVLSASDATLLARLLRIDLERLAETRIPNLEPVIERRRGLLARLDEAIRNA